MSISTPGKKSPLCEIEDHIVTLMLALSDTGHPLTVGQCLPLINSLIKGTTHQQKLIAWKKSHSLQTNKGRLFELNRTNWTLFRNFRDMYDNVEKHMVDAGVARPYDEPIRIVVLSWMRLVVTPIWSMIQLQEAFPM